MWNRVVLLSCGMVIGWGLANYWTCPLDDLPRHRYRVTLGLIVALALCFWIAWGDPASGITALLIVALAGLVSYAGRARQVSSVVERSTFRLAVPTGSTAASAIILVNYTLPQAYTGPEDWAWYLRRSRAEAGQDRGWFSRPLVLARIRAWYGHQGSLPVTVEAMAAFQERLQTRFGSETLVAQAHPTATPRLESQLIALASQGISTAVVVPIDLSDDAAAELEQRITLSHIGEQGLEVILLANTSLAVWGEQRTLEQVAAITGGLALPELVVPSQVQLDYLAESIGKHVPPSPSSQSLHDPSPPSPGGL